MRNTKFKSLALLSLLTVSVLCFGQKKETVTIKGKITVKDTGKPPVGIITVNEKGVADYMVMGDIIGTNRHTFVEKDGSFKFTINKGGTIVLKDGGGRYMQYPAITDLNESKTINIELNKRPKNKDPRKNRSDELTDYEKGFDIHKRVKVKGMIVDAEGKPVDNVTIFQRNVYKGDMNYTIAHTLSNKDGSFSYEVQKGSVICFFSPGLEGQQHKILSDSTLDIKLLKANPFK